MSWVHVLDSLNSLVSVMPSPVFQVTAGDTLTDQVVVLVESFLVIVPEMLATGISRPS